MSVLDLAGVVPVRENQQQMIFIINLAGYNELQARSFIALSAAASAQCCLSSSEQRATAA
jgi:hypothetical protein